MEVPQSKVVVVATTMKGLSRNAIGGMFLHLGSGPFLLLNVAYRPGRYPEAYLTPCSGCDLKGASQTSGVNVYSWCSSTAYRSLPLFPAAVPYTCLLVGPETCDSALVA